MFLALFCTVCGPISIWFIGRVLITYHRPHTGRGPQYLVETKVAPHAKAQERPSTRKPLHPPLKLDATEHGPQDEWATHYIIPHTTTRKNDAAKITVTRHLPHTTQVYELTAPKVLVTHRRHDE